MATSIIELQSRRELFVDEYLIDCFRHDASLKLHPPERKAIVWRAQGPLENAVSGLTCVFADGDGQIRLYYRGYYPLQGEKGDSSTDQTANVLVSTDGIQFERPDLGLFDYDADGRNNVVWKGIQAHNLTPFYDTNPACNDAERFKAVGGCNWRNLYALTSPDGYRWQLMQEEPLDIDGWFDSINVPFWDARLERYRLFSRYSHVDGVRTIQSCESVDFLNWTKPVLHQYDDGVPAEDLYTNATTPCPGAEHILLSFPMRFVAGLKAPVDTADMVFPATRNSGMSDGVFMTSRDGVHWERTFMEAWLRAGLDERNWTHRNQRPGVGILTHRPKEWSMYASEHYGWDDNRIRRLTIRPWGFASLHAGYGGGEMITKVFRFTGNDLRVNVSTSAVGSIACELQTPEGEAVPGFALDDMQPFYGDQLDASLTWQGHDLSALAGQPVRLRVVLKDADLFALRFASA